MINLDHSEPKADVLNHYDIFPYTFVQHRVCIQKTAGEMYKFCVPRQVVNISELYFIICKMGVLLPTFWWSLSLLEFQYLTPLAGKFVQLEKYIYKHSAHHSVKIAHDWKENLLIYPE